MEYRIKEETFEKLLEYGFKAEDIPIFYAFYNMTSFDINLAVMDKDFMEQAHLLKRLAEVMKEVGKYNRLLDWIISEPYRLPDELKEDFRRIDLMVPIYQSSVRGAILNIESDPKYVEKCIERIKEFAGGLKEFWGKYIQRVFNEKGKKKYSHYA